MLSSSLLLIEAEVAFALVWEEGTTLYCGDSSAAIITASTSTFLLSAVAVASTSVDSTNDSVVGSSAIDGDKDPSGNELSDEATYGAVDMDDDGGMSMRDDEPSP